MPTDKLIKKAADSIRASYAERNIKLKSAHAHELVAAYLGFNSNAALRASGFKLDNGALKANHSSLFLSGARRISKRLESLNGLPFDQQGFAISKIPALIAEAIHPACEFCGHDEKAYRIEGDAEKGEPQWSCVRCAESDDFTLISHCKECPKEVIYFARDLSDGRCMECSGEWSFAGEIFMSAD